jgi:hypothetical protein
VDSQDPQRPDKGLSKPPCNTIFNGGFEASCFGHTPTYYTNPAEELPESAIEKDENVKTAGIQPLPNPCYRVTKLLHYCYIVFLFSSCK